jgi:membrane protease YdiL (CAAX protease family)
MSSLRRYIAVAAFVLAWIAAGFGFHLDPESYLVLGVPLVALFQVLVRRQPLQKLWVRGAESFRLDGKGLALAAALMVVPGAALFVDALPSGRPSFVVWMLCSVAGAVFAAFALRNQRAAAARRALLALGFALLIGGAIMVHAAVRNDRSPGVAPGRIGVLLGEFLLLFPVCFVLEEVAFRGALDSHLVDPASDGRSRSAWLSAIFVSALWGAWHLPIVSASDVGALLSSLPELLGVHTVIGICLSFCWRRAGTLVLPAAAHALLDAYRDSVLS